MDESPSLHVDDGLGVGRVVQLEHELSVRGRAQPEVQVPLASKRCQLADNTEESLGHARHLGDGGYWRRLYQRVSQLHGLVKACRRT